MTGSTNDQQHAVGTDVKYSLEYSRYDANISIIADGTAELAGTTVTLNSLTYNRLMDSGSGDVTGVSLGTLKCCLPFMISFSRTMIPTC